MDATHRPEIEVVSALFDSDYDANRAVNMLIEGQNSVSCSSVSILDYFHFEMHHYVIIILLILGGVGDLQ